MFLEELLNVTGATFGTWSTLHKMCVASVDWDRSVIVRLDLSVCGKFCCFEQGVKKRGVSVVLGGNAH